MMDAKKCVFVLMMAKKTGRRRELNMQTYIGVKRIQAERCERNGQEGYKVVYPDGHESWSPKEAFEKAYFEIERPDKLSQGDIDRFIHATETSKADAKTVLMRAVLKNGFVDYETSSCVDPINFDMEIGEEICLEHIKNRMWKLLGFVLQWADHGLGEDKI
ncbi:Gp49 family protein [Cloacibacillus porcorum]|uniref:Gp49 family protein n=1 Tax=Cloacibacillus porcorum TaxID=1197717 RepID=UPI003D066B7A